MEKLDSRTLHQVWERVQQRPQSAETADLAPLLTGLHQEAALYRQLYRQSKRTEFQPLAKQVSSHIACVKGMLRLSSIPSEDFKVPQPPQELMTAMLRRAYANALGRLTEYEKRTADPTFGPVFHILAAETKNTLRTLTELCAMI